MLAAEVSSAHSVYVITNKFLWYNNNGVQVYHGNVAGDRYVSLPVPDGGAVPLAPLNLPRDRRTDQADPRTQLESGEDQRIEEGAGVDHKSPQEHRP